MTETGGEMHREVLSLKQTIFENCRRVFLFLLSLLFLFGVAVLSACTPPGSDSSASGSDGQDTHGDPSLLRTAYRDYFRVGAAVSTDSIQTYSDLLPHFDSITAEWQMKWRVNEPSQGAFDFSAGDTLLQWAQAHDTALRGHCLLWYKSLPPWVSEVCTDRETALAVIEEHVRETVRHYGDSVYCWDVANEVLDGTVRASDLEEGAPADAIWRTGDDEEYEAGEMDWYALCGEDFLKTAFRTAQETLAEIGAEDVQLFYNDYSLNDPNKREACVRLVEMLRRDGIRIDGVGMQAHYNLHTYLEDKEGFMRKFEDSVRRFTSLGLDVHITELDIRVYASSSEPQKFDSLPYDLETAQAEMYGRIFEVCRRYSKPQGEGYGVVSSVTTWGVADDQTCQDTSSHKEYPLIFGVDHDYKRAYYALMSL